ncbi:ankyrin repeat domain-containing protein [bacterium]|nr:ankyrin repeat domain-containing protein [bacterium]
MSKDNETKFGNMPLGRINEMLVSFIGEDAFLDYCEKYHKDWGLDNWHSRDAFSKHLKRLFEEKESSYRDLNPNYDQSVYRIAYKILDDFCDEYGLPRYIADTILGFYDVLNCRLSYHPIFETYSILDFVIRGFLHIFFEIDEIGINNDADFSYRDAETKYKRVFDDLGRKFQDKNGKKSSLEKLSIKLSDWYSSKINKKISFEHFETIIYNCKKGQNPAKWKDMKAILDFCKKEEKETEVSYLIEAYLTANVKNFIEEIQKENLEQIGSCFEYIRKNVFDRAGLLYEFHCRLFNPLGDNSEHIDSALLEILENHIYLQDEKSAEALISNISNIKEIAPEAASFYCNWLRAYIAVAKGEIESAQKLYNEAFNNIHFAGICTQFFLKQAFALSVYYADHNPKRDFRDTVLNTIDPEKTSQTPLPNDGKRFWEYGCAIGIFDKPAEDAFLEYVYRKENFSAEFPQTMFFPGKGIDPDKIKLTIVENIKEKIEEEYNRLSALKKGSINTRLTIFNGDGQRRPPLSMAIWLFSISSDERFLDLIDRWLDLFDWELDFNKISDLGETPLNAATMVYKDFCAKNSDTESPVKKRLKKIITHIFGKTKKEYLGIATKRKGIHALQNIIDSCDIELLKEFVEGGLDIDSIRFPPDKVSPVYYTIGRIFRLQDPKRAARTHLLTPENTNFKYLDAPGITAEDRKRNFNDRMNQLTPEARVLLNEYVIREDLGDESTYLEQIEKLKEICLYLIDQTKDQDAYKFSNNLGTEWTSLTFAAETDDVDLCRALLEHGADPNISLKTGGGDKIPNTFLHRCIRHDAWHVLEMFLRDFQDAASVTIKEHKNSGEYAPFTFFFEKNKEKRMGFMEKFIKLFESCGADFTIDTCKN